MDRLNAGMCYVVPKYPLTIETIHTSMTYNMYTIDFLKEKLKRCRMEYKSLQSTLKEFNKNTIKDKEVRVLIELGCRDYKYKIRGLQSKIDKHKKRIQVDYKNV